MFFEVLSFVAWCNVLVRQSDACPIACLAQSVNVVRPLGLPLPIVQRERRLANEQWL